MKETVRLDKYLADMGVGTRSEVKNLIRKGRIRVNGDAVKKPEQKITIGCDEITFDGSRVDYVHYEYYMLNKPAGTISASSDPKAETVIDLIDEAMRKDLFPVGRLDKDTEGLLLITNDGDLAHQLLSPKKHVDKVYYAKVLGHVTKDDAKLFEDGVVLEEDFKTMPAKLEIKGYTKEKLANIYDKIEAEEDYLREKGLLAVNEENEVELSLVELTIHEGKFHQVKRMFEAVGKKVVYLKRLSMGCLSLDDTLALGEYRPLTEIELEELRQ